MLAVSRTVRDGLMSAFEFLCIVERDGGLVYTAMPNGRTPATDFTLTKIEEHERDVREPGARLSEDDPLHEASRWVARGQRSAPRAARRRRRLCSSVRNERDRDRVSLHRDLTETAHWFRGVNTREPRYRPAIRPGARSGYDVGSRDPTHVWTGTRIRRTTGRGSRPGSIRDRVP